MIEKELEEVVLGRSDYENGYIAALHLIKFETEQLLRKSSGSKKRQIPKT